MRFHFYFFIFILIGNFWFPSEAPLFGKKLKKSLERWKRASRSESHKARKTLQQPAKGETGGLRLEEAAAQRESVSSDDDEMEDILHQRKLNEKLGTGLNPRDPEFVNALKSRGITEIVFVKPAGMHHSLVALLESYKDLEGVKVFVQEESDLEAASKHPKERTLFVGKNNSKPFIKNYSSKFLVALMSFMLPHDAEIRKSKTRKNRLICHVLFCHVQVVFSRNECFPTSLWK